MEVFVKTQILPLLECPICGKSARNTHLCNMCFQPYCWDCICHWLNSSSCCPLCRACLNHDQLKSFSRFDELQQKLENIPQPDRCEQHPRQMICLFCFSCEVCICANCCFSEPHVEHKETIVTIETAFEHYKKRLSETDVWTAGRVDEVSVALDQAQMNEKLLAEGKDHIVKLRQESKTLIESEADVATLQRMIINEKTIAEIRLLSKAESVPSDYPDYFVAHPTKLVFHFTDFNKNIKGKIVHNADPLDSYGFQWTCQLIKESGHFQCYLKLVHGKFGIFGIGFENQAEKILHLAVGKFANIGTIEADEVPNKGTYQLTTSVRQTYGHRCSQLETYTKQLEGEMVKLLQDFDELKKKQAKDSSDIAKSDAEMVKWYSEQLEREMNKRRRQDYCSDEQEKMAENEVATVMDEWQALCRMTLNADSDTEC